MTYPEILLYDLWFLCPQSHVFVMPENGDLPWEYEGGPEGKQLAAYNIKAKAYPNYGDVIEVHVLRKAD